MTARSQPAAAGVVRAGRADIDVLSQVIADAFFPLAPCQWLIPDEAARSVIFPSYFRMYVEHAVADGIVHTTPGREAAALWIPLGATLPEPPVGYREYLAQVTGPWVDRFTAFDEALEACHLTGTAHHHLAILAVRPDRQGQGTGTALLAAHHAVLDQEGITAYLEASDERTRRIYLRHGYVLRPDAPIRLPDGGPEMWPMVRYPQPVRDVS